MGKVSIIASHEMFAMMHDNYKGDFDKRIGTLEKIKEYWKGANTVDDPKFKDHPLLNIPRYKERCIPIAIHGDGGPYTQKTQNVKSIDVMSWASELGAGWSLDVPISSIIQYMYMYLCLHMNIFALTVYYCRTQRSVAHHHPAHKPSRGAPHACTARTGRSRASPGIHLVEARPQSRRGAGTARSGSLVPTAG